MRTVAIPRRDVPEVPSADPADPSAMVHLDGVVRVFGRGEGACARSTASRCRSPGGVHGGHGPSGSGKSTLLQFVAGLDWPTQGGVARRARARRPGRAGARPAAARAPRLRLSVLQPARRADCRAERRAALAARGQRLRAVRCAMRSSGRPRRAPGHCRRSSRAVSSSASRSPAPWSASRASLRRRADRRARHPRRAARAGAAARASTRAAGRWSWSPTTRPPPPGPTASCSWPTGGSRASWRADRRAGRRAPDRTRGLTCCASRWQTLRARRARSPARSSRSGSPSARVRHRTAHGRRAGAPGAGRFAAADPVVRADPTVSSGATTTPRTSTSPRAATRRRPSCAPRPCPASRAPSATSPSRSAPGTPGRCLGADAPTISSATIGPRGAHALPLSTGRAPAVRARSWPTPASAHASATRRSRPRPATRATASSASPTRAPPATTARPGVLPGRASPRRCPARRTRQRDRRPRRAGTAGVALRDRLEERLGRGSRCSTALTPPMPTRATRARPTVRPDRDLRRAGRHRRRGRAVRCAGTFALAIAQRRRETAVLRALGASPPQVRRLIAGEALLVSLVAGALGLLAGGPLAT